MTRRRCSLLGLVCLSLTSPFVLSSDTPATLPEGARLVLTFDESTLSKANGSSSRVRNLAGSPEHAIVEGCSSSAGRAAEGIRFESSADGVIVDHAGFLDDVRALTLSVWFRGVRFQKSNYLISKEDWAGGRLKGFVLRLRSDGRPDFTVGRNGWHSVEGSPLEPGHWHHLVATYEPGRLALWVDGARAALGSCPGELRPSSYNLTIGRGNFDKNRGFSGDIDEIAIFDRVLSKTEIEALYSRGKRGQSLALANGTAARSAGGSEERAGELSRLQRPSMVASGQQFDLVRTDDGNCVVVIENDKGFQLLEGGSVLELGKPLELTPSEFAMEDVWDFKTVTTGDGVVHVFVTALPNKQFEEATLHYARIRPHDNSVVWHALGRRLGLHSMIALPGVFPRGESELIVYATGRRGDDGVLVTATLNSGKLQVLGTSFAKAGNFFHYAQGRVVGASYRAVRVLSEGVDLNWVETGRFRLTPLLERSRLVPKSQEFIASYENDYAVHVNSRADVFLVARYPLPPPRRGKKGKKEPEADPVILGRGKLGRPLSHKTLLSGELDGDRDYVLVESPGKEVYLLGAAPLSRPSEDKASLQLAIWSLSTTRPKRLDLGVGVRAFNDLGAIFSDEETLEILLKDINSKEITAVTATLDL